MNEGITSSENPPSAPAQEIFGPDVHTAPARALPGQVETAGTVAALVEKEIG